MWREINTLAPRHIDTIYCVKEYPTHYDQNGSEKSMWAGPTRGGKKGDPKGITFMFHVKHFFRHPLGLVGVPDLPYSV